MLIRENEVKGIRAAKLLYEKVLLPFDKGFMITLRDIERDVKMWPARLVH